MDLWNRRFGNGGGRGGRIVRLAAAFSVNEDVAGGTKAGSFSPSPFLSFSVLSFFSQEDELETMSNSDEKNLTIVPIRTHLYRLFSAMLISYLEISISNANRCLR